MAAAVEERSTVASVRTVPVCKKPRRVRLGRMGRMRTGLNARAKPDSHRRQKSPDRDRLWENFFAIFFPVGPSERRMHYVTGADRRQEQLLPPAVEDYVAADAPVRAIDAFIDALDL